MGGLARGRDAAHDADVVAPGAAVEADWLRVKAGAPVAVRFNRPVSEVDVTRRRAAAHPPCPHPARNGRRSAGSATPGSVGGQRGRTLVGAAAAAAST